MSIILLVVTGTTLFVERNCALFALFAQPINYFFFYYCITGFTDIYTCDKPYAYCLFQGIIHDERHVNF